MISLQIDTLGRLTWLDVVPDRVGDARPAEFEWQRLFDLMGLEIGEFTSVPPRLTPHHFADERVAWEGAFPEDAGASLRIEAAALAGRPASLQLVTAHAPLEQPAAPASGPGSSARLPVAVIAFIGVLLLLVLTVIFGGLYVAQRNIRNGRGDPRGARRLGFAVAGVLGAAWLVGEHSCTPSDVNDFLRMLIGAGALGGLTWALYLAIEPFMRRHAPEALIGWTRFVDGRLADPLVGRDVLFGCAAGVLVRLLDLVPMTLSERVETAGSYIGLPMGSPTALFGEIVSTATISLLMGLGLSFLYGLTFLATGRRAWISYAGWLFVFAAPGFIGGLTINGARPSATWLTAIFWALAWAVWLFVLFRPWILVFLVMATSASLLTLSLPTLDFGSWYSASMVAGLAIFLGVAAYAFYRCVAWKGGLVEALGGH